MGVPTIGGACIAMRNGDYAVKIRLTRANIRLKMIEFRNDSTAQIVDAINLAFTTGGDENGKTVFRC